MSVRYGMGYVISRVCGPRIGSQALSGSGTGTEWEQERREHHHNARKNVVATAWLLHSSLTSV